jgi:D-alanine-D-alanine ligase
LTTLVVKPSRSGSVLGVSGVDSSDDLPAALVHCFAYGEVAVVESYVEGTDISVGVINVDGVPTALPPVALHYERGDKFDFAARYSPDLIRVEAPATLPDGVAPELQRLAVLAHETLGLRDISRADFLVSDDGTAVLLECAIAPGLTETSLFPFALQAAGTTLGAAVSGLLAAAVARG